MKVKGRVMSNREVPTRRWQHNRIYPQPISLRVHRRFDLQFINCNVMI